MKKVFNAFSPGESIPVIDYITNRKLAKYYNRETQAALVTSGMLFKEDRPEKNTPIFYATGIVECEEYDLDKIARNSLNESGNFSNQLFIEKGMMQISPLTQFKVLYNMTLCFISIEYGLQGDNAAVYSSAQGLVMNALYSTYTENVIIGAGKIYANGLVESGFARVSKKELENMITSDFEMEAIVLFKD
jgi:hypothetical protein